MRMRDVFLLVIATVSAIAAIVGMLWLLVLGSSNVVPPIAACGGIVAIIGAFWVLVMFLNKKQRRVGNA